MVSGTGKAIDLNDPEIVATGVFNVDASLSNLRITKIKIKKNLYGSYKGHALKFFTPDG